MFKKDNSKETKKEETLDVVGELVANFDYNQCLQEIYDDVLHNFGNIIKFNCPNFKSYGITEEQLERKLSSFLHENPEGIILIGDKKYSANKIVFKIIDIATHEKILEYVNVLFKNCQENILSNKVSFYEKLKNARATNGFKPTVVKYDNFNINYDYITKENYFISLIATTILEEYITVAKGSSLYKELKKSNNVLI